MRDRLRRWRLERDRIPGVPPPVDETALAAVATSMLGDPPDEVRYVNVSGYKQSNAFVIWVSDAKGNESRLVYKLMDLHPEAYPAIRRFPGEVGAIEIAAYERPTAQLSALLPGLLRHTQSDDHLRHELFLEDLNVANRLTYSNRDVVHCTRALIGLEAALAQWLSGLPSQQVLRYDGAFPAAFLDYTHDAIEDYASATNDRAYVDLLHHWPRIQKWYLSETPDEARDAVHGDFRIGNIFHDRSEPSLVRVVDLEFAGYGWLHQDLASLLKGRDDRTTERTLSIVAASRPEWSEEQHRRLYQRCRLGRGLLDAALVADQRLARDVSPKISTTHAARVLSAVAALEHASAATPDQPG